MFGQIDIAPGPIKTVAIVGVDAAITDTNLVKALNDLRSINDEWYFVVPIEPITSNARLKALSEWAEATVLSENRIALGEVEAEKLLVVQTANDALRSTHAQTVLCYNHDAANTHMPAAWIGRVAPNYPAAVSWKWKKLAGIPVSTITGPGLHVLLEARVNTYINNNKQEYMSEGICCDSDFIDTVIGRWQIKQDIRRSLAAYMVGREVVPYDNNGFTAVGAQVIAALNRATDNGIILSEGGRGAFKVSIPKRADATREEAANRVMPTITWEATLRGGVHGVRVRGLLTVSIVTPDA